MKKTILLIAACIALCSCEEKQDFTVHHRTPQKMEFVERILPDGFVIGKNLPSEAQAIDLGLSVKWANINIGATKLNEPGDDFAWGEIISKKHCTWDNYEFNEFHPENALCSFDVNALYILKYCFDRYGERQDLDKGGVPLDKLDDAAYTNWGGKYRMPTAAEIKELFSKCTWVWNKPDKAWTVTGPNGNSISLGIGLYWTSTLSELESPFATNMRIEAKGDDEDDSKEQIIHWFCYDDNRAFGKWIRPVCE